MTALCLYLQGSLNLRFFFHRNFTLWQTNFSRKKLFSVTEVCFSERKLEESCFCEGNLFCDINFFCLCVGNWLNFLCYNKLFL